MATFKKKLPLFLPVIFLLALILQWRGMAIRFLPESVQYATALVLVMLTIGGTIAHALTYERTLRHDILTVILFIITASLATLLYIRIFNMTIFHDVVENVVYDDARYILSSNITEPTGIGYFNLYRCDTSGLDCQLVCQSAKMTISYLGNQATPSLRLTDNDLSLMVNDIGVCSVTRNE